ncbi:MAG: DNA repair protein RecO [Planctomycetota bacterium]|nr:DNA repair protein RecO [Planctomycetota bacterium]
MGTEKTDAIVIRVVEFSESSCVVTLFTRDFGKIAAMAKGARRPKSPFESAIDLLTTSRILLLHKSSDSLDLLTEAKVQRRFRASARSLSHLYAGYYVAELLALLTDLGDPHPELFELVEDTIQRLDDLQNPAAVVVRFELNALRLLGQLPSLCDCCQCGCEVPVNRRVSFGQITGGILCPGCRTGLTQVVSVRWPVLVAMRQFAVLEPEIPEFDLKVHGELRGLMNNYLSHLIGKRPRMVPFLEILVKPAEIRENAQTRSELPMVDTSVLSIDESSL